MTPQESIPPAFVRFLLGHFCGPEGCPFVCLRLPGFFPAGSSLGCKSEYMLKCIDMCVRVRACVRVHLFVCVCIPTHSFFFGAATLRRPHQDRGIPWGLCPDAGGDGPHRHRRGRRLQQRLEGAWALGAEAIRSELDPTLCVVIYETNAMASPS